MAIDPGRLKDSWVTRRVPPGVVLEWLAPDRPKSGDLLLCEVVTPSLHSRLETSTGERSKLYPGDQIVCAVAARYASSLLEAVPEIDGERVDLISASGLCGRVVRRSDGVAAPTRLRVLGQAFQAGQPVNLTCFALAAPVGEACEPSWALVVGSDMDSGKTTVCASLIHGAVSRGLRVAAAKLTGTCSARDPGSFRDAGAKPVLDFLDCGVPSTAGCSIDELVTIRRSLVAHMRAADVDLAVLEIADGLLQPETAGLMMALREFLPDPWVVLTTRESLAAQAGVDRLRRLGYHVAAVSGIVSSSPLASREVERSSGIRCLAPDDLAAEFRPALAAAAG
jgi:hypothetical protein